MEIKRNISYYTGGGYASFWKYKGRYRVVKGGRGSKKSTTTALWIIANMMHYYQIYGLKPCVLVLRRFFCTHSTSTFNQLKWAINRLGVESEWRATKSPLQLEYKKSGQKIYFRGLDDAQSITSIVAEDGYLCWVWWEEASQIMNEEDFNKVDLSIRGNLPAPLFKQHTITLNPWSDKHWIKARFFDKVSSDVLALTKNYDCNEFLGSDDLEIFESMRVENPKRFAIEGRGEWGLSEGLIFDRWCVKAFDANILSTQYSQKTLRPKYKRLFGMDFGFSNDPTAIVCLLVSEESREIYVCAEVYKRGMVIDDMYKEICALGIEREVIVADSASPLIIEELKRKGVYGIRGVKKTPIKDGIARLQDYNIVIHPSCKNAEAEFSNYCWKVDPKTGKASDQPIDDFNHLIDAMRYATEGLRRVGFQWARM